MKKKTTVYTKEGLFRAAKVAAARSGKKESEGFEKVLRGHLDIGVVSSIRSRNSLSEEEAIKLVDEEKHAETRIRRGR